MKTVRIGLVITALPHYDVSYSIENVEHLVQELKSLNVEVIKADEPVMSWQEARLIADKLVCENLDLLLIVCGTFALDDFSIAIVKELMDVPLMIWSLPEPPLTGGPLSCGSLLSAVMNGSSIRKMGKDYQFLYGKGTDPTVQKSIKRTVRVLQTVKYLKDARIGMFGYRPPGFYACTFDELDLRRVIGPEIVHIDLSDVLDVADTIAQKEIQTVIIDVNQRFKIDGPQKKDMINTAKLYLSIRRLVERENLTCTAIKCWPELKDSHDMGACFTLSRLNDEGIMSACEADIHGVVTMLILHALTKRTVYFTDILSIDDENNLMLMWHCGSGPTTLASDPSQVEVRNFSISGLGRGVTTEFPIKPGRVTIARLSANKKGYRLFITGGEALKTEMVMRGNPLQIKLDTNIREVLEKIIEEGIEHHYAVVHEDIREELINLCKRLMIEPITI